MMHDFTRSTALDTPLCADELIDTNVPPRSHYTGEVHNLIAAILVAVLSMLCVSDPLFLLESPSPP